VINAYAVSKTVSFKIDLLKMKSRYRTPDTCNAKLFITLYDINCLSCAHWYTGAADVTPEVSLVKCPGET